jgi:O-antigen/teichoic acid export membrane protein
MREFAYKRILLFTTVAMRMSLSIATIIIVASATIPAQFAYFTTAYLIGTLVGLLSNLGYPLALLEDVGRQPFAARAFVAACIIPKMVAAIFLFIIGMMFVNYYAPYHDLDGPPPALFIIIGMTIGSFGDLIFCAIRAAGKFVQEFFIIAVQFILQIGLFLIVADQANIIYFSIILMIVRTTCGILTILAFWKISASAPSESKIFTWQYLKRSGKLAVDGAIVNLSSQLDGLVIVSSLGLDAAGHYQAAARIVHGAIPFAAILASISVPRLGAASAENISREVRFTIFEFVLFALFFGLMTLIFGPIYVTRILPAEYALTNTLWPILAIYIAVRFICSGLGAVLSVLHKGKTRTLILLPALIGPIIIISMLPVNSPVIYVAWLNLLGAVALLTGHGILTIIELNKMERKNGCSGM